MSNITQTTNGAKAYKSSLDAIVDLFYFGPMSRNKLPCEIVSYFSKAFEQDKTLALRTLFYLRDIRGGQGERKTFRTCLNHLAKTEKNWLKDNLNLIPEYGRWDDCLCLLNTPIKKDVITFLKNQLEKDLQNLTNNKLTDISLLAKWMPSEHSLTYKKEVKLLLASKVFGTKKEYRKKLTDLRKALNILETKLVNKDYADVDYNSIPSKAMYKYGKEHIKNNSLGAFLRNDNERFRTYLKAVEENKEFEGKQAKINTKTLYPYDLVKAYENIYMYKSCLGDVDKTIELQWKNLPDYVPAFNGLVVCDTSGSMSGQPMNVAMSLAIYIAERNKSEVWKNYVIPFSSKARFMEVKGTTLLEKLGSIYTGDCSNTDLRSVFDLILDRACIFKVKKEDMPDKLIIVSDMAFDSFGLDESASEYIRNRYKAAGYTMPQLIWWNASPYTNTLPVTKDADNNILLSGASPAILKVALEGNKSILETVMNIICADRYKNIVYS